MIKQMLAGVAVILTLAACNPEQGGRTPSSRHREPERQALSDFWFLGRVYDGQHKERGGVPIHIKGVVVGPNRTEAGHVDPGPGCTPSGTDAMVCETPTAQLLTIEGAGSLVMTFSFATNAVGWQMQCTVSPNKSGSPILEQDTSDRTSGRGMEAAIATCAFP